MSKNERAEPISDGGVSVTASGVEVRKSIVDDSGEVPTIQYDIRSDRNEAVVVQLLDALPPGVPTEAVGFHPEYYGSDWLATDGHVEFHHRLDPGQELVTVCGIQLPDGVDQETLLGKPTVQVEDPSDTGSSGKGASNDLDDDVTLDLESTDGTGTSSSDSFDFEKGKNAAAEAADTAGAGAAGETSGGQSPDEGATLDLDTDESTTSTESQSPPPADSGEASTAAALAADLRAGRIDDQDRKTLKQELNLGASDSTNALLEHVQDKITRKREQLRSEVESLESSVEQLYGVKADAEDLDGLRATVQRLDEAKADAERLESVQAGLSELKKASAEAERVKRLENGLEELQSASATTAELRQLQEQLDRLESTAAEAERVDELDEYVQTLATNERVDDLESHAETLASDERVDDLQDDLADLRETAATADALGDLDTRVEQLDDRTVDESRFTDTIEELRSTTATTDDARELRQRLEDLDSMKADEDHLERLEQTIEDEYVAIENIDGTIERRVQKGVRTIFTLGIGIGAMLLALVLGATAQPVAAGVSFAAGVIVIAGWWLLISESSLR